MSWPCIDADHCLVSTAEMVALEQEWLASGLPVAALMEKVGLAMTAWCLARPELLANGVLVLVGPGHNGGDGLVVARELSQAGVAVRIWCPLPLRQPLTQEHHRHLHWLNSPELQCSPDPSDPALWIEALFGLGQTRALPQELAELLKQRQRHQPGRLISLDLPAGLDGESGRPLDGTAAVAQATLTVGLVKRGLVQDAALDHVGQVHRIDAGVPQRLLDRFQAQPVLQVRDADLSSLPHPKHPRAAMKYQRGRVLVVAGSERYRGAALLALEGAQASGAGSVQAAVPESLASGLWQPLPELVLAAALPSDPSGGLVWGDWLNNADLQRLDAVLLGPGLGSNQTPWEHQSEGLKAFSGLLVLDADGLNQLAASGTGWRWISQREGPTWITPHAGEFQRLFPTIPLDHPLEAARSAARCSGATVLLKGAHSVVAAPTGMVHQLISGDPATARTGLGDVLAGFAAGWGARAIAAQLSKQELPTMLTGAALLHGEAARRCQGSTRARSVATQLAELLREQECCNNTEA